MQILLAKEYNSYPELMARSSASNRALVEEAVLRIG
jgi:hypothetical protein